MPKKPTTHKSPLTIGTAVLVSAHVERVRHYPDTAVVSWERNAYETPRPGIITGQSTRYDGIVVPGSSPGYSMYSGDDYEPSYFSVKKCHVVWLVRYMLRGREVPVLLDDVTLNPEPWVLPKQGTSVSDDRYRQYMRDEMTHWPRDPHGRWMKQGVLIR